MPAEFGAVVEPAPAKLNLDLYVERRRADGYHDLDSIVAFAAFGDTVEVAPAAAFHVRLEGPFGAALQTAGESLVAGAVAGLAALVGRPPQVHVTLTKRIPLAAGLGGGSADAAATLRALARLWRVEPKAGALLALARSLGADVPVCLAGRPCRMRGIGDVLEPAPPVPALELLLVNPQVPAPTGRVYGALQDADFGPAPERPAAAEPWPAWLVQGRNALEPAACRIQPPIAAVLATLRDLGSPLVRLCGSGATAFAAFAEAGAADRAADRVHRSHPDWWCQRTRLLAH